MINFLYKNWITEKFWKLYRIPNSMRALLAIALVLFEFDFF